MRQKRAKAYERLMAKYSRYFNFREPYQVLVDDEFATNIHKSRMDAQSVFNNALRGSTKILITQCTMQSLYSRGSEVQGVVDMAKGFERRKCNHKESLSVENCITDVVGPNNKHKYVIASTNNSIRKKLHSIPGIPILHYNRMVVVLEPPSDPTTKRINQIEGEKISQSLVEKNELDAELSDKEETEEGPKKKKRKGPKGPNPLSAKKKSKSNVQQSEPIETDQKKKRKSRRRHKTQESNPTEE